MHLVSLIFRKNLRSMVKKFKFVPFDCISGTVEFRKNLRLFITFHCEDGFSFGSLLQFFELQISSQAEKISLNLWDKKCCDAKKNRSISPSKIFLFRFSTAPDCQIFRRRIIRCRMMSDRRTSDDLGSWGTVPQSSPFLTKKGLISLIWGHRIQLWHFLF